MYANNQPRAGATFVRAAEYAKPQAGGFENGEGYFVKRADDERYQARDAEGYALVGGDAPAQGFVRRQGEGSGPVTYNMSEVPQPIKTVILEITRDWYAPDGFGRIHYLINKFPGDLQLWDEDDWIETTVINNCSNPFTSECPPLYLNL